MIVRFDGLIFIDGAMKFRAFFYALKIEGINNYEHISLSPVEK